MATMTDLAGDVQSALQFLEERPEVDGARIGLIGHSEGGLLAPLVASRDAIVRFVVLLAPPGVPLTELILRQFREALSERGVSPELIERILPAQVEELDLVKDESLSRDELVAKLETREAELHGHLTAAERAALNVTPATTKQAIQEVATPWFRSLMRQDPSEFLSRLDIPVLALFGARDVQVSPAENAAAVERALQSAPTSDYTVVVLPDLNHLFQHAMSGAVKEYGTLEETIAPEVLALVTDWIQARTSERYR